MSSLRFEAIGTIWCVDVYESVPNELEDSIKQRIARFDETYSRFRSDSIVGAMAQAAGTFTFPEDFQPLIKMYRKLYAVTAGAVTPLIGSALHDAGYDANYSLKPRHIRPVPAWDDVMTVQGNTIKTTQPLQLDFGAAGKGYLVDIISELIQAEGVTSFTVDAGGDMYHRSSDSLTVGLEHPGDTTMVIGTVPVKNQALCGSAINRRAWGAYHHVMDPHHRRSTDSLLASWVLADNALQADALATALFFVEPEALKDVAAFESVTVSTRGEVTISTGWPGKIYGKDA